MHNVTLSVANARQQSRLFAPSESTARDDIVDFNGSQLVSKLTSDAFVREFYGIEHKFARQEIGSAKAHRFVGS